MSFFFTDDAHRAADCVAKRVLQLGAAVHEGTVPDSGQHAAQSAAGVVVVAREGRRPVVAESVPPRFRWKTWFNAKKFKSADQSVLKSRVNTENYLHVAALSERD